MVRGFEAPSRLIAIVLLTSAQQLCLLFTFSHLAADLYGTNDGPKLRLPLYRVRLHAQDVGRDARYLNSSQYMTPSVSPRSFQRPAAAAAKAAQHECSAVTTGTIIGACACTCNCSLAPGPSLSPTSVTRPAYLLPHQLRVVNDC